MKLLYTLLVTAMLVPPAMAQDQFGFFSSIAMPDGKYCVVRHYLALSEYAVTCKDDSRGTVLFKFKYPGTEWDKQTLVVKTIHATTAQKPTGSIAADWVAQCSDSEKPNPDAWPAQTADGKTVFNYDTEKISEEMDGYKWAATYGKGNIPTNNCGKETKYLYIRMTIDQVNTTVPDILKYHMVFQSTKYIQPEKEVN